INEVWFRNTSEPDYEEGRSRLREKVSSLRSMPAGCKIADYGTRRRYSRHWHGELLPLLRDGLGEQFVGTSNVYFANH
ncbi:MAG: nicotinate phosphoribosyltransferase, partial [Xanthomonas perforans]|nr:nicotinate phosphoribosyltransferase [Xanthomonas perforans]